MASTTILPEWRAPAPRKMFQTMGFDQLFWLAQKIDHRHDELHRRIKSGATLQAVDAIANADFVHALEFLEGSRNKIWSGLLLLSTPVDDLRAVNPELANDLERASCALKIAATRLSTSYVWDPDPERASAAQQDLNVYHDCHHEYFTVLERVQELAGFEDFRDSRKFAELTQSAVDGPVVVINVNEERFSKEQSRCDALVLTRPGAPITHVPLPNFSHKLAETLHTSMISYLKDSGVRNRDDCGSRRVIRRAPNRIRHILACLWVYVVQPILQAIEQTLAEDTIPHITWCATGPLAFLPLHAAGIYGPKSSISVSDFVVSSYTPTLSMLLDARARPDPPSGPPSVLIVSQPDTPGFSPLPGTVKKAEVIKKHFPNACHLDRHEATVSSVLKAMKQHAWVHLACHGIQDARDPMKSAFVLHDGSLLLSQLMTESLENADLAFLSACETATGDHVLPEESTHLAGGMLAIGYRSVVATMWSIGDKDAPIVADAFYAGLLQQLAKGGKVKMAYMVRDAVKHLREEVGDEHLEKWVPFALFGL